LFAPFPSYAAAVSRTIEEIICDEYDLELNTNYAQIVVNPVDGYSQIYYGEKRFDNIDDYQEMVQVTMATVKDINIDELFGQDTDDEDWDDEDWDNDDDTDDCGYYGDEMENPLIEEGDVPQYKTVYEICMKTKELQKLHKICGKFQDKIHVELIYHDKTFFAFVRTHYQKILESIHNMGNEFEVTFFDCRMHGMLQEHGKVISREYQTVIGLLSP
jgi:hypothetical protein